jgi:hypothetical protein
VIKEPAAEVVTATPAPAIDAGTPKPAWTAPVYVELEGATAIIRRAYARFSPDHPIHRREPNYADDYTSEGARVLTWRPPVNPAPQNFTLAEAA